METLLSFGTLETILPTTQFEIPLRLETVEQFNQRYSLKSHKT
jgi:hypothetical protein